MFIFSSHKNGFAMGGLLITIALFLMLGIGTTYVVLQNQRRLIPLRNDPVPGNKKVPNPEQSDSSSDQERLHLKPSSSSLPNQVITHCVIGGCSGELCVGENDHALGSICMYKSEFACYKKARCEVQKNGICGWTQTTALQACITESHVTPPIPFLTPFPDPIPLSPLTVLPTAILSPTPTPTPSNTGLTIVIEADDYGFYPSNRLSVNAQEQVTITFHVLPRTTYYGGLTISSSKFNTGKIMPGQQATISFIADASFTITSYWPATGVKKADLHVIAGETH